MFLYVSKNKIFFKTKVASYDETHVFLGFPCHLSNAESAYIVRTAVGNKNLVKVSQADRTVVFKDFPLFRVSWKIIYSMYLVLAEISPDSHFISIPHTLFSFNSMTFPFFIM